MEIGVLGIFQNYRDEQDDGSVMQGEMKVAMLGEELGFDSYWATEHHFFGYSMCPDNIQWLTGVAGKTSRIKLGTGAVIMPWNDPYRVASKMALLDQQSGGRALLGFGRGLSRKEYGAFDIPMDEARPRFDEGTELVVRALDTGFFEADTEHFKQPRCELRPRATGSFNDRVFSIGVSPDSAVQAAVLGARLMVLAQQPWEIFRDTALIPYQNKWREVRDSEPPPPVCGQLVYCDSDAKKAEELGQTYIKNYFSTVVEHYEIGGSHFGKGYEFYASAAEMISAIGLDEMANMYAGVNSWGTPEQLLEKIAQQRSILDCDIDVLAITKYGGMTDAEAESSMRLFASEVMPKVRATATGQAA
ncbi:MAG: LLM class flavin-dependent oxidoreductase [Candidatus Binatia bacterium]|nr:LLM class flavin-dependent oxidoreductase [Candidatus Binatia bacterium]